MHSAAECIPVTPDPVSKVRERCSLLLPEPLRQLGARELVTVAKEHELARAERRCELALGAEALERMMYEATGVRRDDLLREIGAAAIDDDDLVGELRQPLEDLPQIALTVECQDIARNP